MSLKSGGVNWICFRETWGAEPIRKAVEQEQSSVSGLKSVTRPIAENDTSSTKGWLIDLPRFQYDANINGKRNRKETEKEQEKRFQQ
jgi:hypothetical protein